MIKMLRALLLILILSIGMNYSSHATRIMGGNLSYSYLSNDTFLVKLTLYRDCNAIQLGGATIKVLCKTTGNFITSIYINKPAGIDITPACDTCTRCQPGACLYPYGIEKYEYIGKIYVGNPSACCDVVFEFQQHARTTQITTGPGGSAFYLNASLNRCLAPDNSSPEFTYDPVNIICIGQDFIFKSGVNDADKDSSGALADSLSFEWAPLLKGYNDTVFYSSNYSFDHPIYYWGFKNGNLPVPRGFHMDKKTGEFSFRPMKIEQTVMVQKITEWRNINGIRTRIGESFQEFNIVVIICNNNSTPVLSGPFYKEVNALDTARFFIKTNDYDSGDTVTVSWDNSIPGAIWSDSNGLLRLPNATLIIPTKNLQYNTLYSIKVEARDNACPVNGRTYKAYQLYVKPPCTIKPAIIQSQHLGCGIYMFYPDSFSIGYNNNWYGGVAPDVFSVITDTLIRKFRSFDTIPVNLNVYNSICSRHFYSDFPYQDSFITVSLPSDTAIGNDSIVITPDVRFAKGPVTFKWHDGDSVNFTRTFRMDGEKIKTISIIVTDSAGCDHSDEMILQKNPLVVIIQSNQGKKYYCPGEFANMSYKTYITNINSSYISTKWYRLGDPNVIGTGPSLSTTKRGVFVVNVEYSGGLGLYSYDTFEIFDYQTIPANAGNDTLFCKPGDLFELKGYPQSFISTWSGTGVSKINNSYYFDPGLAIYHGQSIYLTYNYRDSNGCYLSDDRKITVYETPVKPEIGNYGPFCLNEAPITLNATAGGGIWYGKGTFDGKFSPYTAGVGIHEIIYKLGHEPCFSFDTTFIKVYPLPVVSLNTADNKTFYCKGQSLVQLIGTPSGGVLTGPLTNGTYFNADTTFGKYFFYYKYTDSLGCTVNKTLRLETGTPVIRISRSDTVFCQGDLFELSVDKVEVNEFLWAVAPKADGSFTSQTNKNYALYQPGTNDKAKKQVKFYLMNNDPPCDYGMDSVIVIIADTPLVDFYADPPQYDMTGAFYTVQFYDQSTGYYPPASYLWNFGDQTTSILQNPVATYYDTGYYTVSLSVTDQNKCASNHSKTNFIYLTGIEESFGTNKIIIYPNPTDGELYIKSTIPMQEIRLINSLGKVVWHEHDLNTREYQLDAFPKGLYLIEINDIDGARMCKKVVFN